MDKRRLGGLAAAILLLLLGAWWQGWFEREDPLIAHVREMAKTPPEQQDRKEQVAVRDAFRERMQGMTPEQRQAMMEQLAPIFVPLFMKRFEAEYDKFMAMSPAERRRELDKRIDEMQRRGGPGGGSGGGGGGRANFDPKKFGEFQKKALAWTTPDQRAKFDNGMQMFNKRLQERGLDPLRPGGGFF